MSSYISEDLRRLLDGVVIETLTDIGEVTARILGFNDSDRFLERQTLMAVGRYPTTPALARMGKG